MSWPNLNIAGGNIDPLTQYPKGLTEYLQQMINQIGSSQGQYGTNMQNNAATVTNNLQGGTGISTPIQTQVTDQISKMLSGSGLTDDYVNAMRQSVLKPSQDDLAGTLNRMGAGVAAPSSGLMQEINRRNEEAFNNQLIRSGYENYNNLLTQGMNAGSQSFAQGLNLANLQGNLGQNAMQNLLASNNQAGNLLSDYMRTYLADQAIQVELQKAKNSSLGSSLGNLIPALLGALLGNKGASQPTAPGAQPGASKTPTAPSIGSPSNYPGISNDPSIWQGMPQAPNEAFNWDALIGILPQLPSVDTSVSYPGLDTGWSSGLPSNYWDDIFSQAPTADIDMGMTDYYNMTTPYQVPDWSSLYQEPQFSLEGYSAPFELGYLEQTMQPWEWDAMTAGIDQSYMPLDWIQEF